LALAREAAAAGRDEVTETREKTVTTTPASTVAVGADLLRLPDGAVEGNSTSVTIGELLSKF
jgi:hypothetical protein